MEHRKEALAARARDELIKLAEELAFADNELRWSLIQARKEAGLSQTELAEIIGVRQATISAFENHDNDPRLSTIRRYALAVGARISHRIETADSTFVACGWTSIPTRHFDPLIKIQSSWSQQQNLIEASRVESRRSDFAPAA